MGFKSMKKMETTEPSVDEVGKGMKKGGKTKMAMGGKPPAPSMAAQTPRPRQIGVVPKPAPSSGGRVLPGRALVSGSMGAPQTGGGVGLARGMNAGIGQAAGKIGAGLMGAMRRKKGGEVESKAMHAKEERQIKGIKKELMTHESKPASKAHKGLKTGGIAGYKTGGLIQKFATGGVVNGAAGYKEGGFAKVACKDGGGFKAMKKGNC